MSRDFEDIKFSISVTETKISAAEKAGDQSEVKELRSLLIAQHHSLAACQNRATAVIEKEIAFARQGPRVEEIAGNFREGNVLKGITIASDLYPFECGTVVIGVSGFYFSMYRKLYVPWRHERIPYNDGQMKWRNALGSALTNPAVKRTYVAVAVASWVVDKFKRIWA